MKLLSRRYFAFLALAYSVFIFYVTTIPFNTHLANWPSLWPRIFSIWQDTNFYTSRGDILANFLLFGVLGVLLKSSFSPHEKWHELKVFLSILFGFFLCYFIEVLQELFPDRRSSLLDIWVDTLACATGILFIWLLQASNVGRLVLQWTSKTLRTNPYLLGMLTLSVIYLMGALFPYKIDPHFSQISAKFSEGDWRSFFIHDWGKAFFWWKCSLVFALYGLLGFTAYLAFLPRNSSALNFPASKAFLFSGGLIVLVEVLQILFTPHFFELYLIEAGLLGSLMGVSLSKAMSTFLVEGEANPSETTNLFTFSPHKVLFLGLVLIALIDWLKPFQFDFSYVAIRGKINSSEVIPFYSYARTFSFWTVEDTFRKLILLSGLGGWIAFWLWREIKFLKLIPLLTAVMVASFVFCLELIQIPVVGRHLAVTDVMIGFLAGLIGSSITYGIKRILCEEQALGIT